MLSTVLCLSSASFLVFSLLLLFFSAYFERIIGLSAEYQWLGLLVCYMQVFSTVNLDIWRLEENPLSYGIYSVATVLANFILTLILVIVHGVVGRVYAQVAVCMLFFLSVFTF